MTEKRLEVFQELVLHSPDRASVRKQLLEQVKDPWRHAADRERAVQVLAPDGGDVVAFVRAAQPGVGEVALLLWQDVDGYRVTNIVPHAAGELGIAKYNLVLRDFVERIAKPAASRGAFEVRLTEPYRSLDDWVDPTVADDLRRFSHLANKATGASHPLDRKRWFAFVIGAHNTSAPLDPGQLARWLEEVEDWPADTARELAGEYEYARALLAAYDGER